MRTGLGGNVVDDEFEAPTDAGLFTLSNIKSKEQLDNIINSETADIVEKIYDDEEKSKKK